MLFRLIGLVLGLLIFSSRNSASIEMVPNMEKLQCGPEYQNLKKLLLASPKQFLIKNREATAHIAPLLIAEKSDADLSFEMDCLKNSSLRKSY